MLSRLQEPSGRVKLVDDLVEMEQIFFSIEEMKFSSLMASFSRDKYLQSGNVGPVMSVFGEVNELEVLVGELPLMDD